MEEREILFGDRLQLPSGGSSSCELELLRLLRDVDLAFLERHQRWKARLDEAEDALARRDAELKQTKLDLASSREEVAQLRDHVGYLESFQNDLVAKYDRRIGELKEDVRRIKKRCCDLKAASNIPDGHLHRAPSSAAASSPEEDFWRARAIALEKEVARLRDGEAPQRASEKERELEKLVSEKDGVIDRLTDRVTQLTKRLRQAESSEHKAGTVRSDKEPPDLVEQYLSTLEVDRVLENASELRTRIKRHMHEFTAKIEQDKRTI